MLVSYGILPTMNDLNTLIEEHKMSVIRKVETNSPIDWFKGGWAIFSRNKMEWVVIALIFGVIAVFLSFIPLIGGIVLSLIIPLLAGGMLHAARKAANKENIEIGDLFYAFSNQEKRTPLLIIGLILMAVGLVVSFVMGAAFLSTIGGVAPGGDVPTVGVGSIIVGLMVYAFMAMAFYFAPALVMFSNMAPVDAVKNSLMGSLQNILPFLLFILIYLVLAFVAAIPIMLGFLVLIPVMMGAIYLAYKDIFA